MATIPAYEIQARELTRSQVLASVRGVMSIDETGKHNAIGFLNELGVPYDSIDKAWINTEKKRCDLLISYCGVQRTSFMPLEGLYAPTWEVGPYPTSTSEVVEADEDEE